MKKLLSAILFLLLLSTSIRAQQDNPAKNIKNARQVNDQVIADDLIVQGNLAVGFDAVNNEVFGDDVIRLKENNLRIKFDDTSTAPGDPKNDWQIEANSSADGGDSYYRIIDSTAGTNPFTIQAHARNNALFIKGTSGNVGLGTSTPEHKLEVKGDAQVNSHVYFGDESTNGNWRINVVDGVLTFQKRESGVWVTKFDME